MILSMNADESNTPRSSVPGTGGGVELLRAARILPLATIAAWIITIFVPVLDSGNDDGPRIRITSLGYSPLDPADLDPGMTAIWVLILAMAILPWLIGVSQWWAAAAILLGFVILMGLTAAVIEPPIMMWDGQTDEGMPTGGMEIARPTAGFGLCAIGSLALIASGICAWIGRSWRKHGALL